MGDERLHAVPEATVTHAQRMLTALWELYRDNTHDNVHDGADPPADGPEMVAGFLWHLHCECQVDGADTLDGPMLVHYLREATGEDWTQDK